MIKIGLLGGDLSYSRSKEIYQKLFKKDFEFFLFEYPKGDSLPSLDWFFEKINYLAITNPYKKYFMDSDIVCDPSVMETQNLNNIFIRNGEYYANNTDFLAFNLLYEKNYSQNENPVLILGDGNLSSTVQASLRIRRVKYQVFSRKLDNLNRENVSKFISKNIPVPRDQIFIINTCSRQFEFNYNLDYSHLSFWDLNYLIPAHDEILSKKVNSYQNGLALLEEQAKYNLKIWNL